MSETTTKNVNVYPAQGRMVYEIQPPLRGTASNIELPTNLILRIIKSGHRVIENVSEEKQVLLNVENYDRDNSVENVQSVSEPKIPYAELLSKCSKLESDLNSLQTEYNELKESYDEEKEKNSKLESDVSSQTEKINTMEKEIEKLEEELTGSTTTNTNSESK